MPRKQCGIAPQAGEGYSPQIGEGVTPGCCAIADIVFSVSAETIRLDRFDPRQNFRAYVVTCHARLCGAILSRSWVAHRSGVGRL
jgi:hypothetical protein